MQYIEINTEDEYSTQNTLIEVSERSVIHYKCLFKYFRLRRLIKFHKFYIAYLLHVHIATRGCVIRLSPLSSLV